MNNLPADSKYIERGRFDDSENDKSACKKEILESLINKLWHTRPSQSDKTKLYYVL